MDNQVCVFAPSPQLTVTVEDLDGRPDLHLHAGGQGYWQARMITALGSPVVFCCALGGETGSVLGHLLTGPDLEVRARQVAARNGAYIHDRREGEREELVEQYPGRLTRHEVDDLYELAVVAGLSAGVAVLGGSVDVATEEVIPVSVYERLAADLGRNGCRVVVDLAGARLAAALEGTPAVVKVSHEELIEDGRAKSDDLADLTGAARELVASGVELVVVSRAAEPTLAVTAADELLVTAPALDPVDTRGGGDSMTAGLAAAFAQGADLEAALRLGAAAGALNITRHGLGSGSGDAVRSLVERVEIARVG
ncbi:PfkB family carbohydrate kinase [Actinokineospora sp. PR83]|uniref:PfkB family carbohydrate kinase n=1 Tax=Actinokineospora sp. PR83 TaxID=2884908 RepID=UPI001F343EF0|nr:PfkB family carbohydrate kinase [Actinokineospora sp. PR83]MCG8916497.1 PfkB family carbohydrate kinase [Actinokineospora sp. PR83]